MCCTSFCSERHLIAAVVLAQLDVSMQQFIDFCILCGCDYCGTIRGIGPTTAFKLLKQHGSLEAAVSTIEPSKLPTGDSWQVDQARGLFTTPHVVEATSAKFSVSCALAATTTDESSSEQMCIPHRLHNISRTTTDSIFRWTTWSHRVGPSRKNKSLAIQCYSAEAALAPNASYKLSIK